MDDTEIDIRSILGILKRQSRLIIGTMVVILAVAALAVFSITPLYTGTTLILVDPSQKNILDPVTAATSASGDSARVESEVELVDSDRVLLTVIQQGLASGRSTLLADPEFGVKLGLRDKLLAFFRIKDAELPTGDAALGATLQKIKKHISVRRRGLTYLIAVEAQSEDPNKAAELANAIASTYIKGQIELKVESVVRSRDVIRQQISEAEEAVIVAERTFNNYILNNINTFVSESGSTRLADMRDRLTFLSSERDEISRKAADLRDSLASGNLDQLVDTLRTEASAELNQRRDRLLAQLSTAPSGTATAINLRAELQKIEDNLKTEAQDVLGNLNAALNSYDTDSTSLRKELTDAVLQDDNLPPQIVAQAFRLQRTAQKATEQYDQILARTQDLNTEAALQVADSRIVSPAFPPSKPSYPNTRLVLAAAALFALGTGIAFAFLFENYIGGFTSEAQVEAVTRIPVATVLPRMHPTAEQMSVADTLLESPLSMFAESVRRLRVAVDTSALDKSHQFDAEDNAQRHKRGKVVMVSSSLPGEGKSTTALSLARTLALSGHKTVLIDCDLRKPSVHRQLGAEPSSGLVDFLTGKLAFKNLMDIVKNDEKTGLTAVVGSRRSDIPTDQLLVNELFTRLINTAKSRFDYVILDSPPIEPVVDGLYLAKHADVIAFVIQWAKTPQHLCVSALYKLSEAMRPDTKIVTLLNQQEGKKTGYYSAYSDYYTG